MQLIRHLMSWTARLVVPVGLLAASSVGQAGVVEVPADYSASLHIAYLSDSGMSGDVSSVIADTAGVEFSRSIPVLSQLAKGWIKDRNGEVNTADISAVLNLYLKSVGSSIAAHPGDSPEASGEIRFEVMNGVDAGAVIVVHDVQAWSQEPNSKDSYAAVAGVRFNEFTSSHATSTKTVDFGDGPISVSSGSAEAIAGSCAGIPTIQSGCLTIGGTCTGDLQCTAALASCTRNDCTTGNCTSTTDCTGQNACTNLTCTKGDKCTNGPGCTKSDACTSSSACTGPNPSHAESCTLGETCTGGDTGVSGCTQGASCTESQSCTNGMWCTDGTGCTQGANCTGGAGCTIGEMCTGGMNCTDSDNCTGGSTCTGGDGDAGAQCTSGTTCTGSEFTCTEGADCTNGAACTQGTACTGGDTCTGNGGCTRSDNCTNGGNCTNGAGCTDGNACTGGTFCTSGVNGKSCTSGSTCTNGSTCTSSHSCTASQLCSSGENCTAGSACTSGSGCTSGGSCTKSQYCSSAADCEPTATRGSGCTSTVVGRTQTVDGKQQFECGVRPSDPANPVSAGVSLESIGAFIASIFRGNHGGWFAIAALAMLFVPVLLPARTKQSVQTLTPAVGVQLAG